MTHLRTYFPSLSAILWMTLVWTFLWGDVSWGNIVNGALLSILIAVAFPMPRVPTALTFRPLAVVWLAVRFVWDMMSSAFRVAAVAFRPGTPTSAVVRVQLRSHSDLILATTAGMTTLIPGSVAINVHRLTGVIYLHVFDVPEDNAEAYLAEFHETVMRQEERLLRAFGPKAMLADAGYVPGWRPGSGDLRARGTRGSGGGVAARTSRSGGSRRKGGRVR